MARKTRQSNIFVIPVAHSAAVLRELAQGFYVYAKNGLALSPNELTRQAISDNAFVVFYRLLFVFYAEARAMLPDVAKDAVVRLRALHTQMSTYTPESGMMVQDDDCTLWMLLKELCHAIWQETYAHESVTRDSVCTTVTPYRGHLFDPQRYPFLEQHAIGDAHLFKALTMLLWVDGKPLKYGTLDVRLLGTLYAELLEYHLEVEPEYQREV